MDPHRPFFGSDQEAYFGDFPPFCDKVPAPSSVYDAADMVVPPFLPDLPEVRRELAEYTASSRRADDVVGQVLEAIDREGAWDDTLVVFLSDHGISMPFAKSSAYWFSIARPSSSPEMALKLAARCGTRSSKPSTSCRPCCGTSA